MFRLWLLAALLVTSVAQSSAAGGAFSLGEGRADLVLLVVISWAMLRGTEEGSFAGLVGGVLLDLFSGAPFGLNALLLALVGLVAGLGEGSFSRGSLALLASTAILVTVAYHGGTYLALQALGWSLPSVTGFARVVAPSAALNAVLLPLAFRLMRRLIRVPGGWARVGA